MIDTLIRENWALVGAAGALLLAVVAIAASSYRQSRWARLKSNARQQRIEKRALDRASKARAKATKRIEKLKRRGSKVPPQKLSEALATLKDAERLVGIRAGALKVAENKMRMIIVEEYPPGRHESLRERYGIPEVADNRPFLFDSPA